MGQSVMRSVAASLFLLCMLIWLGPLQAQDPLVTYNGDVGPLKGKRVVLISGDDEYRSEEALPQLAKILASRHGCQCTVLFAIDPKNGTINPKRSDNIPGLKALETADLMILFAGFRNLPDDQMAHIAKYLASGKPVIALRTATHAFSNDSSKQFAKYSWQNKGEITADYWPFRPGTSRFCDFESCLPESQLRYPNADKPGAITLPPIGTPFVTRVEVMYKEGGIIEWSRKQKTGSLEKGQSIAKGDKVKWNGEFEESPPTIGGIYYRIKGDYIEIGMGIKRIEWVPVLKIGAKDEGTWKWQRTVVPEHIPPPFPGEKDWTTASAESKLELGLRFQGMPAAVVRVITLTKGGSKLTGMRKYVKGIGEVERSDAGPSNVGAFRSVEKLVENDNRRNDAGKSAVSDKDWPGGFGGHLLGETWIGHHGELGTQSTRGILAKGAEKHPILRGIKDGDIWGPSNVFAVRLPLPPDCTPLVMGQVLKGMKSTDEPLPGPKNNPMMPVAWTRTYVGENGVEGRVFTTTMGSAQDLLSEGTRRMLVNATDWALLGEEGKTPDMSSVDLVGTYTPSPTGKNNFVKGLRPPDLK